MKRFDRNLIILIASVLVVGVSIAALVGHYAPAAAPAPPLRQVPNAHIATAFGHGPTSSEIQEIVDLRAALGWVSGEVERLTKELVEYQRKEKKDEHGRTDSISKGSGGRSGDASRGLSGNGVGGSQRASVDRALVDRAVRVDSASSSGERQPTGITQPAPMGGDANVTGRLPDPNFPSVTQPPVQTVPGGGRTKNGTDKNAIQMAKESGTSRPSALDLARSGLPPWSGPFNDFRGAWDAPPVPQPFVSPRMMAVMAIRRPSNPPEPTLPVLCDEGDVHGRWGTEYFSQFAGYEYLADKCALLHTWKRDGGDLHVFLAIHGYPSPGAAYDLHVPWEAYAGEHYWGTHWLGVCTALTGCQWIPVDAENRLGITVQVPMDLPFEQPALLRSARGAMGGGKP